VPQEKQNRFSPKGVLPAYVYSALDQYKIRALTRKTKWQEVVRGQVSLPTFRLDMGIPIRCDKEHHKRLEKVDSGDVEVDLMICRKPYLRVVLETRKLLPTEKLQNRIEKAYTTLNHQLSASVIDFAKNHGAGTIQIEDLTGLKEQLTGTFIGARWRYHQLQQFLEYKGKENGITVRAINPKYTSRRCSECGYINIEFDRNYRDSNRTNGKVVKFHCPKCGYEADPDYNAARKIAILGIDKEIRVQCKKQELEY